jgi:hypothetical protein
MRGDCLAEHKEANATLAELEATRKTKAKASNAAPMKMDKVEVRL